MPQYCAAHTVCAAHTRQLQMGRAMPPQEDVTKMDKQCSECLERPEHPERSEYSEHSDGSERFSTILRRTGSPKVQKTCLCVVLRCCYLARKH